MKLLKYQSLIDNNSIVYLITPGLFTPNGGMLEYAKLWQNEIKKMNVRYMFCIPYNRKGSFEHPKTSIYDPTNYKYVSFGIALLSYLIPMSILIKIIFIGYNSIKLKKGDIIHITGSYINIELLLLFFLRTIKNFDSKVIYTLHDPIPHDDNKGNLIVNNIAKRYFKFLFEKAINIKGFYLHIHNNSLIPDFLINSNANIIIHPHPIGEKIVCRNRTDNSIRLGFLGQIHPYKGLDIFYNAIKELEDYLIANNVQIIIAGSGKLENINEWISLRVPCEITNKYIDDSMFHELMANLDCLILPYKEASQTGVGAMALAYEIPIIATKVGGLPDLINNYKDGYLCQPNSASLRKMIFEFIEKKKNA